ncbi:MAG: hypothetical protein ACLFSB_15655 [Chitinispirillaceae bacterium]
MKKQYEKPYIVEEIELSTIYAQTSVNEAYTDISFYAEMCRACSDEPPPES